MDELQSKLLQQDRHNMADDEEPFVLDSQEERELRTQVCQQAAEVWDVQIKCICTISHVCMLIKAKTLVLYTN